MLGLSDYAINRVDEAGARHRQGRAGAALGPVRDGEADAKYPRYIDGERRAPPEDCGGTPGFEAFLEAIADPSHLEHKEATEWHQGCYAKAFDPEGIDDLDAKLSIGAIAKRRAAGKASQAKQSR